jgi:hypothetical protein
MPTKGELGNVGEPSLALTTRPEEGPGRPKALAWPGASTRSCARQGHHARPAAGQGSGKRATSEATREGERGSLSGASSRGRWGTKAHGTHGRAGDAGHHVASEGQTGETLRSPTVTPQLPRMAAQAAHDPERVLTTLAHLIEGDVLREASRHTSQARAPGSDGVTAQP